MVSLLEFTHFLPARKIVHPEEMKEDEF